MRFTSRHMKAFWAGDDLYCSPRRLILKVELGEAPDAIPCAADVRAGVVRATDRIDGGVIDRILKRFAGEVRVMRLHSSAFSNGRPGNRHVGFDDLEHVCGLSRTFRVELQQPSLIADFVDALQQIDRVESASPYYFTTLPLNAIASVLPQLDAAPGETFTASVDIDQAWQSRHQIAAAEAMAYEPGDASVILAIVDTGVAQAHPELTGRLRPGFDSVQVGARDLASGMKLLGDRTHADNDPEDEVGHGTAVAAQVSAIGHQLPPGLAGACGLLPIRVLAAARVTGRNKTVGLGAIPDIDQGVKAAIDLGANVINMSFGTPRSFIATEHMLHADVVRYGIARGCVMVAASGNSGQREEYSPAALPHVISVGAVTAEGQPAAFSTHGPTVDLCAPGESIVSAGLQGYQLTTGTSFAAPFVSATSALLVSLARRRSHPISPADVKRVLVQSSQRWPTGENSMHGAGVLNSFAALRMLDEEITNASAVRGRAASARLEMTNG